MDGWESSRPKIDRRVRGPNWERINCTRKDANGATAINRSGRRPDLEWKLEGLCVGPEFFFGPPCECPDRVHKGGSRRV